jgi:hypothetical protein
MKGRIQVQNTEDHVTIEEPNSSTGTGSLSENTPSNRSQVLLKVPVVSVSENTPSKRAKDYQPLPVLGMKTKEEENKRVKENPYIFEGGSIIRKRNLITYCKNVIN